MIPHQPAEDRISGSNFTGHAQLAMKLHNWTCYGVNVEMPEGRIIRCFR